MLDPKWVVVGGGKGSGVYNTKVMWILVGFVNGFGPGTQLS